MSRHKHKGPWAGQGAGGPGPGVTGTNGTAPPCGWGARAARRPRCLHRLQMRAAHPPPPGLGAALHQLVTL